MTYPSHYEPTSLSGKGARRIGPNSYIFDDAYAGQYRFSSGPGLLSLKLQLKWYTNAGFAGDMLAQRYGRRWSNIDLKLLPGEPGLDVIKNVINGKADFGVTTGDQLILAAAGGVPLVAIGRVYQQNPLAWVSHPSAGITGPAALAGRRIGLTEVDDRHVLSALLAAGGLSIDIPTTRVTGDDLERFILGEIDAYPIYTNTQGTELDSWSASKKIVLSYLVPEELGIHAYSNVYFTTATVVNDYPEIVQRFATLVSAGWQFALKSPHRATEAVRASSNAILGDTLERSVIATLEIVRPKADGFVGEMALDGWRQTQEMLLRSTQLKAKQLMPPHVLERQFTNRFMEHAHQQLRAA
jgi:NitT/TauT family transport system substrate-binding protein